MKVVHVLVIQISVEVVINHTNTIPNKISYIYIILISQLIANGLLGALGKFVPADVEEVPRKDTDRNLL